MFCSWGQGTHKQACCAWRSLAMVLNTLSIDPRRPWKGPWRYFHETMLDCCLPIARVAREGIALQQVSPASSHVRGCPAH